MSEWKRQRTWFLPALGWVVAALGPGCGRENPDGLSYRAKADFTAGRLAEAEADFRGWRRIRHLTVSERLLRSQVASERGRIDEALTVLADPPGPTKGPDAALIASGRGQLEMDRYRFRAGEAELKRALTLDPGRVEARRRLIMLYAQQGRSAEIAAQAPALISMPTPDFLDLFFCTLGRHQPVDRAEQAQALERAVQADPGDRASQLALAECLRRLGRLDEAESNLDSLRPTDPDVLAIRALVALDRGDSSRAQALVGADSPGDDHPALARLRGRLALARDDAAAAIRHFRAALNAAPDDRDAHFGSRSGTPPGRPTRGLRDRTPRPSAPRIISNRWSKSADARIAKRTPRPSRRSPKPASRSTVAMKPAPGTDSPSVMTRTTPS